MCTGPATAGDVRAAMPHPAAGRAADPITLQPADDVVITTLVDNVYDALLTSEGTITRAPLAAGTARAPQFEAGRTTVGLMAEHGFSALVTVRRGDTTTSVLFDTGLSPDAMVTNAARLGLDLPGVHAVVLSHGHFDHAGGLAGLAGRRGTRSLPMIIHPLAWTRRRLARPGGGTDNWPTLSKHALAGEGFEVIERRQPSLLAGGSLLITGEVDRTTDFEHGMPPAHQHWTGTTWEPDPQVLDDQALIANVRGKGLVIVTGCGHAGAVNIVRHAQRLTGVPRLHALLGGPHLSGAYFTPAIGPTVRALTELAPHLLVPGHCTGWRAQHTLAAALPDSWVQGSSGTRYHLTASLPPANECSGPIRAGHGAMDFGAGPDHYLRGNRSSQPARSNEMTAIDLNGATVVVTGASRGFGRATAVALAKSGAQVVGVARHGGGLEELQRELGDALSCEIGDVADPELPARLFGTYRPAAVVLNAGAPPVIAPLDEQDWDTFSVSWNVDVRQAFHFIRQALRTPPPDGGVVVTMSSGAALAGSPMSGGYAGAKAMVRFISAYAAEEAARRTIPVRFVSILPHITNFGTGRLGVRAYAARAGITEEEFVERAGATATPDQVARHVVDVIADGSYSAPAYHLSADGLRPLS